MKLAPLVATMWRANSVPVAARPTVRLSASPSTRRPAHNLANCRRTPLARTDELEHTTSGLLEKPADLFNEASGLARPAGRD